jgi:hypothetical protein
MLRLAERAGVLFRSRRRFVFLAYLADPASHFSTPSPAAFASRPRATAAALPRAMGKVARRPARSLDRFWKFFGKVRFGPRPSPPAPATDALPVPYCGVLIHAPHAAPLP